nr:DUF2971 domain-containing protein [uncultured Aminipila sp.]
MDNHPKDICKLKYYDVSKNNQIFIKLNMSTKKQLYHYTTKSGIEGILGNNSLWVTHRSFLDDTTEIHYIYSVLEGVIIYLNQNRELYDMGIEGQFYIYEAIIKTLDAMKKIYINGVPIEGGEIFLLSLTERSNNKYLLENYSGKDGAIIEFQNNIDKIFLKNKDILSILTAKVEYDFASQMTIIIEDINEFYSELLNNLLREKTVDYVELVETIKQILYIKILNYSFFFKHHNFSKEEEYRMVFLVDNNYVNNFVKYRTKSGKKIPYIDIKLNEKSIVKTIRA